MEVRLAQTSDEKYCILGGFSTVKSNRDRLVFSYFDPLFIKYSDPNHPEFILTVYHEMVHAMDSAELFRCDTVYEDITSIVNEHFSDTFNRDTPCKYEPFLLTLRLLGHYRAEGIATLCSSIITNTPLQFSPEDYSNHLKFFRTFTFFIFKNRQLACPTEIVFKAAYETSASILFQILKDCNKVSETILDKIQNNYQTGEYNLSDSELKILLETCRKLTLSDYIQALTTHDILKDTLIDLYTLLNFCATIREGSDYEDRATFLKLLEQKSTLSVEIFQKTLQDISSYVDIPQHRIEEMLNNTQNLPPDLREKVRRLYIIYKNEHDANRKELCLWVFAYLIDKEDIIHDELPVYGIVDDITMLDLALDILKKQS
jgi:uncharacterized membrane protein YkvA (DUF1232 family)